MIIDRKFKFVAVNPCNNHVYTEENAMIFCAKDAAVPNTLRAYYAECIKLGCNQEHIDSIKLLLDRVEAFQRDNESRIPDTVGDCEIDRCINGKV